MKLNCILSFLLLPLTGCGFLAGARDPVWTVVPESIDLKEWNRSRPFAIPALHLIIAILEPRYLVAFDSETGKLKWKSKFYVEDVRGFDGSHITVGTGKEVLLVDPATGEPTERLADETAQLVRFDGVNYAVIGSRQLVASRDRKQLWADRLGFLSAATAFPEMYQGVLIFRGKSERVGIDFSAYTPLTLENYCGTKRRKRSRRPTISLYSRPNWRATAS